MVSQKRLEEKQQEEGEEEEEHRQLQSVMRFSQTQKANKIYVSALLRSSAKTWLLFNFGLIQFLNTILTTLQFLKGIITFFFRYYFLYFVGPFYVSSSYASYASFLGLH